MRAQGHTVAFTLLGEKGGAVDISGAMDELIEDEGECGEDYDEDEDDEGMMGMPPGLSHLEDEDDEDDDDDEPNGESFDLDEVNDAVSGKKRSISAVNAAPKSACCPKTAGAAPKACCAKTAAAEGESKKKKKNKKQKK